MTTKTIDFHDIQAETPDLEDIRAKHREFRAAFEAAADADGRRDALDRWDGLRRELDTWGALVGLRFQQDTRDAERKAALELRDEMAPKLMELDVAFMRSLRASGHAEEIAASYGTHLLDSWDCQIASYEPSIEEETVAEAKKAAAYTELVSSARFEFRGETLNLSQLGKYSPHKDRDVRYEAAKLRWDWFGGKAEELDHLYDELVGVRQKQSDKLGYPSFIELAYKKLGRTDYGPDDVARYREAVREHVVPLGRVLREKQRQRLGLDRLMAWDHAVQDPEGAPKPKGDHDWMMDRARAMFDEMGEPLGSFFRLMADGHFLDLKAREGKAGGGFCTGFPSHGMPFIFANFNGTKGDVEVFTHEVGHAFQCWCSRDKQSLDYLWPTAEAAEIHSMSLEFLTWPHMEKFFGDDGERFRRTHLAESLLFLPYGAAIDHFQHMVFENPSATPADRLEMWRELYATYLPWADWGDIERAAQGGLWQGQLHVYRYPFYYIDYTLAQACALQFLGLAQEDPGRALETYVTLCKRGGEAPFQDLVHSAGLRSPFDDGCLADVVATATKSLDL
jgi:M3 family oligoendopeptidase